MSAVIAAERPAPAVPNAVLGTAVFLFTEVMLFAGLISAFVVLRAQDTDWPPPGQPRLPIVTTAANTVVLLASGLFTAFAVAARRRGRDVVARDLARALALGALFVAVQGWEWTRLVAYGLSTSRGVYAGAFYATVGVHALHAVAGLGVLAWALRRATRGALSLASLQASAMFWGFVVGLWPLLYGIVYLW